MHKLLSVLGLGIVLGFGASRLPIHTGHAATVGRFGQFAGTWSFHGGGIIIDAAGHAQARFRTYVTCSTTVLTACDYSRGQYMYPGGFTTFSLGKVQGNKAYGSVTASAFSYQVATTITLVRNANDTLSSYGVGSNNYRTACGPQAPAMTCGA